MDVRTVHGPIIKALDIRALVTEKRDLMPQAESIGGTHLVWPNCTPFEETIVPWRPSVAYTEFMLRYKEITNG
jgi:hypothetical protein